MFPTLFKFTDKNARESENQGKECRKLGCLEYADDIVLKAEDKAGMEELLRITKQYGR